MLQDGLLCHRLERSAALAALVAVAVSLACPLRAHAHIDVDLGESHSSRTPGGSDIKSPPCGSAGSERDESRVHTYRPGATINITVVETIPHPGYFRISFDDDGDDDFVIPSGTNGEFGDCAGDPGCGPGLEDYCSNDTVLLDNLDPHAAGSFGTSYTWSVTLPNVECDNCTLQIIQMMNDLNIHFAPYPDDDIYYHCIDLVLSNDAPEVDETPVQNDGMVCDGPNVPDPGEADAGPPDETPDAGAATGGTMSTSTGGAPGAGTGGIGGMNPAGASATGGVSGAAAGTSPQGATGGTSPMGPDYTGGGIAPAPMGTGGQAAGTPAGPAGMSGGGGDGGGCSVASATSSPGSLAPLVLAMFLLHGRRRSRRAPARRA